MISFTLPIEPIAKGRPVFGSRNAYTPARTRKFESSVRLLSAKHKPFTPYIGPLKLTLRFVFKPPQKWARDHHTVKPDCSNLAKGVEDALNGLFWEDDSQITHLVVNKVYDFAERKPRIEIQIEEIKEIHEND